ncbi:MAG: serine O-acetyltransferase EpsC [Candidatus Sumerlaeia bacterium]
MFNDIGNWQRERLDPIVDALVATYQDDKGINHIDGLNLPQRNAVYDILDDIFKIMYPGYVGEESVRRSNQRYYVGEILSRLSQILTDQYAKALRYRCRLRNCESEGCAESAAMLMSDFMEKLPQLREMLKEDIQAAYEGDPAALTLEEICTSYPFIDVITTHRVAHEIYLQDIPLIPRIMSERAHSQTGVDIHPGARIGKHFFIDHGTGVVIGETTEIGNNVKIYQGVTLGALSFPKDEQGNIIKGGKRHPTIGDNVTIYAGATILGGDTVIGDGTTIGGNTWITRSIDSGSLAIIDKKGALKIKTRQAG